LIFDRPAEQISNVVERPLLALAAVPSGADVLCPGDLACGDRDNRRSERPERSQIAPVRRPLDDPHQQGSSSNDRDN
jgi:hypothetical protein